jgi:Methylamine utilisation protein MauE
MSVTQVLIVQLTVFLAALLFVTGLHKLIRRERIQAVLQDFAGVTPRWAPPAVLAVGASELLAGVLLCSASYRAAGAVLAGVLWGGYLWLILRAIAQGRREVDCGCTFGAAQRPLGAYPVARNVVLTGMAVLVAVSSARSVSLAAGAAQLLAACTLVALYAALDQVMALAPPRRGELL